MHNKSKILTAMFLVATFVGGCNKDSEKQANVNMTNSMKECLARTPAGHDSLFFYTHDGLALYKRLLNNEKYAAIRQTELFQDLLSGNMVSPAVLAAELSEKSSVPFADKIVDELLKGEICGAVEFNDGTFNDGDVIAPTATDLSHKDFVLVKRLTGGQGLSGDLLQGIRKIGGESDQVIKLGSYDLLVAKDYLLLGTAPMVAAAKPNIRVPREVQLGDFINSGNKELVISLNVSQLLAGAAPTTRPLWLEPFRQVTFVLSAQDKKSLGNFAVTTNKGLFRGAPQKLPVDFVPQTSRGMIVTSGWDIGALWEQVKSQHAGQDIVNNSFAKLATFFNGEVGLFFDGFLGTVKDDTSELNAALVLAFGLQDNIQIAQLENIIMSYSDSVMRGKLNKINNIEKPAKSIICADYKNSAEGDVRCFAITDKQLLVGYKEAVRSALASLSGRLSDVSDLENLPQEVSGKHNLLALLNPGALAKDFYTLVPREAQDFTAPFVSAMEKAGVLEMVLDGNSDLLSGELYGF